MTNVQVPLYVVQGAFALLIGLVGLSAYLAGVAFNQPAETPRSTATVMAQEHPTETPEPSPTPIPQVTASPEPTATPQATAAPVPTATPPPTRQPPARTRDICDRHPVVQDTILQTLRTSRCAGVDAAELFRIRELPDKIVASEIPFQPGDFTGLVNVRELSVRSLPPIPSGTFSGLNLDTLTLYAAEIAHGAFDGAEIRRLTIREHLPQDGVLPPSLRELALDRINDYHNRHNPGDYKNAVISTDFLRGLQNLEWLSISVSNVVTGGLTLHEDALSHTPNLRGLKIHASGFHAGRSMVAGLSRLEYLTFTGVQIASPDGEDVVELHPGSPLAEGIAGSGRNPFAAENAYVLRHGGTVGIGVVEWGGK